MKNNSLNCIFLTLLHSLTYHKQLQFSGELEQGKFYLISGKVTERNDELQLVTDRISPALETDRKLWLNLRDDKYNQKISQILREFPGSHQVILHY